MSLQSKPLEAHLGLHADSIPNGLQLLLEQEHTAPRKPLSNQKRKDIVIDRKTPNRGPKDENTPIPTSTRPGHLQLERLASRQPGSGLGGLCGSTPWMASHQRPRVSCKRSQAPHPFGGSTLANISSSRRCVVSNHLPASLRPAHRPESSQWSSC